ncbi:MAG: NAD-dependent protein deacetylase [Proteobacteria bacterium]|nr:NAD-dependent protein deacetylase [Pseudomonadota bacterium]
MDAVSASDFESAANIERLAEWLAARSHVTAITGAGVSTESGIPDYRDGDGNWKRSPPVQYRDFVESEAVRKRYWARSMVGWPMFTAARPSAAHFALAGLERVGHVTQLVTQNVDRLHQRAGSRNVVDLHGRLDVVRCLANNHRFDRDAFQTRLRDANPDWNVAPARIAPDGDADLEGIDFDAFNVPACEVCGGVLKPDVVFYGESVPRETTAAALAAVEASDGVLVAGSSLMVWSSFRLVRAAVERSIPVVAVNRGRTRADDLYAFKCEGECGAILGGTAALLAGGTA